MRTQTLEQVENDYIVQVLEQTKWKISGKNSAIQILGRNRSTLRARMRKRKYHETLIGAEQAKQEKFVAQSFQIPSDLHRTGHAGIDLLTGRCYKLEGDLEKHDIMGSVWQTTCL